MKKEIKIFKQNLQLELDLYFETLRIELCYINQIFKLEVWFMYKEEFNKFERFSIKFPIMEEVVNDLKNNYYN